MSSTPTSLGATRFQARVEHLCAQGLDGRTLLHDLAEHIRAAVPCDGALLLRIDPTTVLPTDGVVTSLPPARCTHFWDNELLEDDYNKFVELARRDVPAATLSAATGGDLARSRRYTAIYRPLGLGDELRVSFTARDGSCWAIAALVRREGALFTEPERDLLGGVSAIVAEALRAAFAAEPVAQTAQTGPALVVIGDTGEIQAATPEARRWLHELVRGSATGMTPVPEPVYLVAARARAAGAGLGGEPAWTRARTADGHWLHLHATCLEGSDPFGGAVVVVLTPARAPDLAPLVALAYRLTPREQEVLQFLARGLTTAEMAQRLDISHHTVRDHIKALFGKVGVRSRAELVARLFADHYLDRIAADPEAGDMHATPASPA